LIAESASMESSSRGWWTRRKVSLVLAGTGLAGVVSGAVFGYLAQEHDSDAAKQCPDRALACSNEQAHRLAQLGYRDSIVADVAFGVGAAAMIAAGYLWFTGTRDEREQRLRIVPAATPHSSTVLVMGSF
jgi:hypothetical protein